MTPTHPPSHTHTHPTPNLGGCEEDLSKKTAPDGTNRQTDGHGDSMTDPAQRAESVKIWSFGSNYQEMVHLWQTFCLSILEQSCAVLGGMITAKNKKDLERTQHNFAKFVLQGKYTTYKSALISLGLDSLEERRKKLTLAFAQTSTADGHFRGLISKKRPRNGPKTRHPEFYQVTKAHTERF